MFIRAKVRTRKAKSDGPAAETWDFRVVESRRVAGRKTPQQRTVVSLGSLRSESRPGVSPQGELSEFKAACLVKMKAAGITPSNRMREQLDALLGKLSGLRQAMPPPTVQPFAISELVNAITGGMKSGHPAYRKSPRQPPASPSVSFKRVSLPAAQPPKR